MDLLDALRSRRSIRRFDPQHRLSEAELRHLIGHAQLAPTSFNMQNWHFVAVTDSAVKEQLWQASWRQAPVRDASVVILITGDYGATGKTERSLRHAPPEVRARMSKLIVDLYAGQERLQRDEACRSAGFAGMALMLVAKSMGLDSCPLIGFDAAQVSAILGLDADHPPALMVTIGKALAPAFPRTGFLDFAETVSLNRFGHSPLSGEPPG